MRESGGLIRQRRTSSNARRAPAIAPVRDAESATGLTPRSPGERAARFASPVAEKNALEMCRTQARRLAITVARNERGYLAYEIRRTDHVYDLAIVDTTTRRSYVVHTVGELAELMTELHDPAVLADAQSGTVLVKTPFYEEVRGIEEEYANVVRYTLVAHFHPGDGTDAVDVTIEPALDPGCDLTAALPHADACLDLACDSARAEGEYERSRLLAETSRRLRCYQRQYATA